MSTVRQVITETVSQVLAERGRPLASLNDADTLWDTLGLDSLDLAVAVVRLEQRLGRDPFQDGRPMVASWGEFVALYEQAEAAP